MKNTDKLQELLGTGWFKSEVTENRHITIKDRLTISEEHAEALVEELEAIMVMAEIGQEPTPLQKIAFHLLKSSY